MWQFISCVKHVFVSHRLSPSDTGKMILFNKQMSLCFFFFFQVFRPGDEGLFWYTVLSGSLEMLQEDNNNSSKVSVISVRRSRCEGKRGTTSSVCMSRHIHTSTGNNTVQ